MDRDTSLSHCYTGFLEHYGCLMLTCQMVELMNIREHNGKYPLFKGQADDIVSPELQLAFHIVIQYSKLHSGVCSKHLGSKPSDFTSLCCHVLKLLIYI